MERQESSGYYEENNNKEPVWMNSYHCVFDRSFEQYVDELPAPEELIDELQQRKHIFCWLYTPQLAEVMSAPGDTTKMELVGASYSKENGSPVQTACYYRYGRFGQKDFIMVTDDGELSDGLTFEELIVAGANIDPIQKDLH
jgi:hypothetical protein